MYSAFIISIRNCFQHLQQNKFIYIMNLFNINEFINSK